MELKNAGDSADLRSEFVSLFAVPLNPVAPGANKKVPVPKGLDLDKQINELPKSESEDEGRWWERDGSDDQDTDDDDDWRKVWACNCTHTYTHTHTHTYTHIHTHTHTHTHTHNAGS